MPLINSVPSVDLQSVQVQDHDSVKQQQERDPQFQDFEEVDDDEFLDSDMEGSILNRGRPTKRKTKPTIPQRSDKRTSMLLEGVMIELKGIGAPKQKEADLSDPHELYLSSEEDASFSDDYDDTDSLVDFESSPDLALEASNSPPSSRGSRTSQEDTARIVSYTTVGKPQIINISLNSPTKPARQPLTIDTTPPLRPSPLKLYPSALRRLSISSTSSTPPQSATALPPRKSSKLASLVTSTKHAFLASDPFALSPSDADATPTPKTPISMAAAAWKTGFSRTLSKARKPSRPDLSRAYTSGIIMQAEHPSHISLNTQVPTQEEGEGERKSRQRAATTPQTESPVRYEDVMRGVIIGPPRPVVKDRSYSLGMGMRGLARRKSVRGRSDRYVG